MISKNEFLYQIAANQGKQQNYNTKLFYYTVNHTVTTLLLLAREILFPAIHMTTKQETNRRDGKETAGKM